MSDLTRPARPVHRNIGISQIAGYRLPAAGIASILHRISGALLFLLLPFVLYLFDRSLTSIGTFESFRSFTSNWFVKLVVLAVLWAFLYHFAAGIRYLLLDLHLGIEKTSGKQTALAAMAVSSIVWLAFALKIIGVF